MTQSAASKNILRLENDLGVQLFDRSAGGMVPTTFGLALAHHARIITDKSAGARTDIELLRNGSQGTLNIGCSPMWSIAILPEAMRRLQQAKPLVRIKATTGVIDTLVPQLLKGEIDMICSALDYPDHSDIKKVHLIDTEYVILARNCHPLHLNPVVALDELLEYSWVGLSNDLFVSHRFTEFFTANGINVPRLDVEVSSLGAMFAVAQTDDLLLAVASPTVPFAIQLGLSPIPIKAKLWHFPTGVAFRREHASPLVADMLEELHATTSGLRPSTPANQKTVR